MSAFADMVVVPRPRWADESGQSAPVDTPVASTVAPD